MHQLESEIRAQVAAARAALEQARAADDDYLAAIHQSELDSLLRTAYEHGLQLEAVSVDLTLPSEHARAS